MTSWICFLKEIFRLHGMPEIIVSDRDKIFTSSAWATFTQMALIQRHMTTSGNPQADGQVERVNKILSEKLVALLKPRGASWVQLLPMVEFAYNNSYQGTIKTTPFVAANGYHPRYVGLLNPLTSSVKNPLNKPEINTTATAHAVTLMRNASEIKEAVTRAIAEDHVKKSLKANQSTKRPDFKVGDQVLIHKQVYTKPHKGDKFQLN